MLVPVFHGTVSVEGDRLELDALEARQRRQHLKQLKGRMVEVVIRPVINRRTADQNAYWHAVPFPMLKEYFGYTSLERLKYDLLGECFGRLRSPLTGRDVNIIAHTSELSVQQGVQFTDWMLYWAATEFEEPFIIPPPQKVDARG